MHKLDFLHPVKVRCAKDDQIKTIDDIRAMQTFLENWPVDRRGPVFHCAMKSCSAAIIGHVATEDARRSFVSFARITSILVDDGEAPVVGNTAQTNMSMPHAH